MNNFYPRPPRGGRHASYYTSFELVCISIHALREEGDSVSRNALIPANIFLSTPSARRATWASLMSLSVLWHFYPRPPRGGRHTKFPPHCRG